MHAPRFCQYCGAGRLPHARFCSECGEALESPRTVREGRRFSLEVSPQAAPFVVIAIVLAVATLAVLQGLLFPAPRKEAPTRQTADAAASLPEDHPPIEVPAEVQKAISELVEKAKSEPDNLDLWRQVAQVQYRAGLLQPRYLKDAESAYQHILAKVPQDLEALRALGNIAYERQQPTVAMSFYQQYLAQKPDDPEVRTDYGTMLLASGKQDEAISTYRLVLEKHPEFFQAHFNLGVAYHGMGKFEEALAAFRKARDLAPDERIRSQVDQVLARIQSTPVAEGTVASAKQGDPAQQTSFRAAAESLFRQNPVMGSRVQRIEWQGESLARVYLQDFPMEQMGPQMRSLFRDRMLGRLREQKRRFSVQEPVRFELVDATSGSVMDTLSE